jgi:hypothetical protein
MRQRPVAVREGVGEGQRLWRPTSSFQHENRSYVLQESCLNLRLG